MKGIAEITANFLIPCLSISEICKSFRINNVSMWLPILIYCILNVSIGYIIGVLTCYFVKIKNPEIRRLILIVFMFSNSTSIQLIYIDSLGPLLARLINTDDVKLAKSQGYVIVLLYTIFVNFLRWSIGYYLMKPEKKEVKEYEQIIKETNDSVTETSFEYKNHSIIQNNNSNKIREVFNSDGIKDNLSVSNEKKSSTCLKIIKEGINMPFVAGVAAIIFSSIPVVGEYMANENSVAYKLIVGIK